MQAEHIMCILNYCADSKYFLLFGDFNSRTGVLPDYLEFDESICEINHLNVLRNENSEMFGKLNEYNISTVRNTADNNVNTYWRHLIELCKNNNSFIINGRIGYDKTHPKVSCKDRSTVEYFIKCFLFCFRTYFSIHEQSELYSDAHCPLSLILSIDCQIENKGNDEENILFLGSKIRNWDPRNSDRYLENFDVLCVAEIETASDQMLSDGNMSLNSVNNIVKNTGSLFKTCSKQTFGE